MDEQAFLPGTPQVQLEEVPTVPVWIRDERAKVGSLVLTNHRILFIKGSGGPPEPLVTQLLSASLEMLARATEHAQVLIVLAEIARASVFPRRLVADLHEFTLADGSSCRVGKRLGERWEPTIHRLLTERHQRSVVPDGTGAWRVT